MSSETTATCAARALETTTLPHAPPKIPDPLPCPICQSVNTKFCYYNNYNLSQPRHFCKSCRRYWTHGGALRNVPVGGSTRKNSKRCRSSSSQMKSTSSTATATARVFAPKPAPGPELLASDPNPEFPENFISLPSIAQQEPGFIWVRVWARSLGIGELGDGGEMCSGDCFACPSIAVSMPAEGSK